MDRRRTNHRRPPRRRSTTRGGKLRVFVKAGLRACRRHLSVPAASPSHIQRGCSGFRRGPALRQGASGRSTVAGAAPDSDRLPVSPADSLTAEPADTFRARVRIAEEPVVGVGCRFSGKDIARERAPTVPDQVIGNDVGARLRAKNSPEATSISASALPAATSAADFPAPNPPAARSACRSAPPPERRPPSRRTGPNRAARGRCRSRAIACS